MTGFSIIIPVKEINDYLRESIPHLLALEFQDFAQGYGLRLPPFLPAQPQTMPGAGSAGRGRPDREEAGRQRGHPN